MTTDAAEDDLQFRRMKRRTRWIAALLEGGAAAAFIGMFFGSGRSAGIAFGAVALVAFWLWPTTIKGREFSFGWLAAFGALVVPLGAYLWLLIFELSVPSHLPHVSHLQHLWDRYSAPGQLLRLLAQTLEGVAIGVVLFGIITVPIAIGIAWLVVIFFGHSRFRLRRSPGAKPFNH